MSLISSFIQNQLINALETEFVAHSSDIQEAFVKEVEDFANEVLTWVKDKIKPSQPTAEE